MKMEARSYRLANYEIIEEGADIIWWKAHGGFANAKSGRCFVEGNVLFIGPSEREEDGFLINEFLEYLDRFPRWGRTKYYCPSFVLYTCNDDRLWHGIEQSRINETHRHNRIESSSITCADETNLRSIPSMTHIRQVKGKLGEVFRRCKGLIGFRSEQGSSEG
jgi:hypothetical protein